jgi:hypothetical protein
MIFQNEITKLESKPHVPSNKIQKHKSLNLWKINYKMTTLD